MPSDHKDRQSARAQLLTLESVNSDAGAQINQLRKSANELSRPSLRPLHILDLPDEILVAIFGAIRGRESWHDDQSCFWDPLDQLGTQYIQSARLTCRRFCSTSSHYLINVIPVEVSYASLTRLDKLSNHPTISKGVAAINVHLAVYDNVLAGDLVRFVEHHNTRLLENISTLRGPLRDLMGLSEEDLLGHAEKVRRITRAWTEFSRHTANYSPTKEDIRYQDLLERGFEEYRSRFLEQQELLDGGVFVSKIASAMAAMPAAKRLAIHDGGHELSMFSRKDKQFSFGAHLLDDEKLCEGLLKGQRMSYEVQHRHELGSDAIPVIPALLAALDAADVRITSLGIELSTMSDFSRLDSAADTCLKIGSAMRDLKAFNFSNCGSALFRSQYELEVLRDFLALIINAERLQSLSVRLNLWDDDSGLDPATMPLVSVIKARTLWPNLSSVILDTLHIQHSDLENILNCVRSPNGYVGLHKIHLVDGSWVPVLDALKERHGWSDLTSPSGAECEAMSLEQYELVFGPYDGVGNRTQEEEAYPKATEAEIYIRGWGAGNPLTMAAEHDSDLDAADDPGDTY